jgi:GTPase KRas
VLLDEWIRRADGFVLFYSIADRKSFLRIKGFWEDVMRIKGPRGWGAGGMAMTRTSSMGSIGPRSGSRLRARTKAPMVLVGNGKDDLGEEERKVKESEGIALARELRCDFWECSARTGVGVDEAFYGLVRKLRLARR